MLLTPNQEREISYWRLQYTQIYTVVLFYFLRKKNAKQNKTTKLDLNEKYQRILNPQQIFVSLKLWNFILHYSKLMKNNIHSLTAPVPILMSMHLLEIPWFWLDVLSTSERTRKKWQLTLRRRLCMGKLMALGMRYGIFHTMNETFPWARSSYILFYGRFVHCQP